MSVRASSHDPGIPGLFGYRDEIGSIPMATFSPVFEMKSGDVTIQA